MHKALGVGRVFRSWIKECIEEYGFTEDVDYEVVEYLSRPDLVGAKSRQQTALRYIIIVSMTRELAMVEHAEQGRIVRQYFIKCEEELRKVASVRSAALHRRLRARIAIASYFKPMCAALEVYRVELNRNTFRHHYTMEVNMLTRIVLGGATVEQRVQASGITGESRDHMSTLQLKHPSYLEQNSITLIELGQDYHRRKAELIRLSQRQLARRMEENSHV